MKPTSPLYKLAKRIVWCFWKPYTVHFGMKGKEIFLLARHTSKIWHHPDFVDVQDWAFENLSISGRLIK